jgi:uncharacterized membrane protein YedE/YeeE
MSLLTLSALGALIGLPLGYAMQRTHLCFNSAYRMALLQKDYTLLRTIALAIVIQMVGLYALAQFGIGGVRVNAVPFFWLANIVGGFAFGVAMTFAEGCSSTVWYRVGNGNLGALVTLIGFAVGEWVMETWNPLAALRGPEVRPASGAIATVPNFLGLSPWLIVIPLALAAAAWLWRGRVSSYLGGWNWRVGGLVLGLIGAAAWVVAWPTGWHYGVGVVGATGPWVRALYEGPRVLNWGSFMVLMMPVGALIAAIRHSEFRWQTPNLPSTARMALAGVSMGMSATFAGGCNIGHGFSGLPTLALSSITATLFTFFGAAVGVYWRFVRPQPIRLESIPRG